MSREMVRRVGFEPTMDFRHAIMSRGPPTVGRPSYYSLLHNVKTLYRSPSLNRSLEGSVWYSSMDFKETHYSIKV